jgi:hypothetical protein
MGTDWTDGDPREMRGDAAKQARRELEKRLRNARALEKSGIDPRDPEAKSPPGAVQADPARLSHINTYGVLPRFYIDRAFICRDCGREELWTAEQQKWWYEEAKGHIDSCAVRCRACRQARKANKH